MSTRQPIALGGAYGSPYSIKMRAVMRYRHIPFRWVLRNSRLDDLPDVPVKIIPVLAFPGGDGGYRDAMVDSSPQILRLEAEFPDRSIVPPDPAVAFLDMLVEDYADEWVTKAMYHYRWAHAADVDKASRLLPLDQDLHLDHEHFEAARRAVAERQVSRRPLVGSSETNAPVIVASYTRLLELLQAHLAEHDFVLGSRPGRGDFGLFGQLSQLLWWDPTSAALGVERAPRVVNWAARVDDLSWWEIDGNRGWFEPAGLPDTVNELLKEIGRTYAPFLLANAAALDAGADEVVCEIDGTEYRQAPFKYQGKCLRWLRDGHAALDASSRRAVDGVLDGTGCELLLA